MKQCKELTPDERAEAVAKLVAAVLIGILVCVSVAAYC